MITTIFCKKLWILNFCLLSFFTNTIYPYSSSYKEEKLEAEAIILISSFYLGLIAMGFAGLLISEGKQKERDIPITHEEKVMFIMRNFLPKEELEKFLLQEKQIGIGLQKMGKIMIYFGLLSVPAGLVLAILSMLIKIKFKKINPSIS